MNPEEEFIRRISSAINKKRDEAILFVGLRGGGKVIEPHPNPKGEFICVWEGMRVVPELPDPRAEHHVPPFYRD